MKNILQSIYQYYYLAIFRIFIFIPLILYFIRKVIPKCLLVSLCYCVSLSFNTVLFLIYFYYSLRSFNFIFVSLRVYKIVSTIKLFVGVTCNLHYLYFISYILSKTLNCSIFNLVNISLQFPMLTGSNFLCE